MPMPTQFLAENRLPDTYKHIYFVRKLSTQGDRLTEMAGLC